MFVFHAGKSVSSQKKSKPMRAIHSLMPSLPSSSTKSSRFGTSSSVSGGPIKFYNRGEPYYEFTNFYPAPVVIDGQRWPSTEHYFQAQKFVGTPYLDVIRGVSSAREAFQISRNPAVSHWRRSDWDAVKDDVMLKALTCKFTQHKELRKLLWETGEREIIEHTTNDSYWADGGGPDKGLNKLGKLLMQVRGDIVAVCGPYKPSKASSESLVVVNRCKLKRSSSLDNLAMFGHKPKESSYTLEQAKALTKKPTVKRSSSISRLLQYSDSNSSAVTEPEVETKKRAFKRSSSLTMNSKSSPSTSPRTSNYERFGTNSFSSIPTKPTNSFYKQTFLYDYVPQLSKRGTSGYSVKRTVGSTQTTAQPRTSSSSRVAVGLSSSYRNPITHLQWYPRK